MNKITTVDPVIDVSRIMWAILAASVSWLVSVLVLPVARAAPTTTDARLDNFDYNGIFKEKVTAINPVRGARGQKNVGGVGQVKDNETYLSLVPITFPRILILVHDTL